MMYRCDIIIKKMKSIIKDKAEPHPIDISEPDHSVMDGCLCCIPVVVDKLQPSHVRYESSLDMQISYVKCRAVC